MSGGDVYRHIQLIELAKEGGSVAFPGIGGGTMESGQDSSDLVHRPWPYQKRSQAARGNGPIPGRRKRL